PDWSKGDGKRFAVPSIEAPRQRPRLTTGEAQLFDQRRIGRVVGQAFKRHIDPARGRPLYLAAVVTVPNARRENDVTRAGALLDHRRHEEVRTHEESVRDFLVSRVRPVPGQRSDDRLAT